MPRWSSRAPPGCAPHRGACSASSSAFKSLNCTTRVVSAGLTGGPIFPRRGPTMPSVNDANDSSTRAVITVMKYQDFRPLRDLPRDANRKTVGIRRRQRELPVRQTETLLQVLAHKQRVFRRQHERDAFANPFSPPLLSLRLANARSSLPYRPGTNLHGRVRPRT